MADQPSFFAVTPKDDCPHVETDVILRPLTEQEIQELVSSPCRECGDLSENWICLNCAHVFCSRYIEGHMAQHFDSTAHAITVSLSDLSFWCYKCDSYIVAPILERAKNGLYRAKFGEDPPQRGR